MTTLDDALSSVSEAHATCLRWFEMHRGQDVPWSELGVGVPYKLGFAQQGIFKPKELSYAISVKHSASGPYEDGELAYLDDTSWHWKYIAEGLRKDGSEPPSTRALLNAMEDGVPVGVLTQSEAKGPYRVHGLGTIEGYDPAIRTFSLRSLQPHQSATSSNTERLLVEAASKIADVAPLAAFKLVVASIKRRQGQGKFRSELLRAFENKCAMSASDALPSLEAAHIFPVSDGGLHAVSNGLLLRADLHTLFDLAHVAVHPDSRRIVLSSTIRGTTYAKLDGRRINEPSELDDQPDATALRKRFELFEAMGH